MMFITRSFRALMWRNMIYRKRRWLPSLIEFFLPALCVASLYFIKIDLQSDPNSSLKSIVVPASYPTDADTIIPLSFQDYVTALQAKRMCIPDPTKTELEKLFGLADLVISGIDRRNWPVPFVFCNSYKCKEPGEDATDYCTYRIFALAPMDSSAGAKERMGRFKGYVEGRYPQLTDRNILPFDYDFIRVFDNNDDLNAYVTSDYYGSYQDDVFNPKVGIAVLVGGIDSESKLYEYTIRVNSTNFNSEEQAAQPVARTTPSTERIFSPFTRQDQNSCSGAGQPNLGEKSGSCTGQYIYNGAVTVQRLLNDWILADSGAPDVTVSQTGATFLPFPTKEYTQSGFYQNIAPFAPLLFTLGLLYPISSTIRSIVLEKEHRQKELMKMMSVTECDIGWSWFISLFSFFCLSGALTAVFTNLLYSNSNYVWLLVFWELSFISCIVYCFLIAAISTKATRATLIGIMIFFVGYFLPFVVDYQDASAGLIALVSLHPVTAYTYGLIMMGYLEDSGVGVRNTTVSSSDFPSGYTFIASLSMLAFDSILWGCLSWYFNRILRGDWGTTLPWYFPFTRQYWFPKQDTRTVTSGYVYDDNVPVEAISETMKKQQEKENASVHIYDLRKQFDDKTAVDGLNLSMYSGQITALLGHNGAGKTTTIGMLTGMVPPTSGYANVAGHDIRTDLSSLRENVGVCLQHDCLFPQLTVKEHIQFFSRVKGLKEKTTSEEFDKSVMSSIEDVALLEKRHTYSKDLSGGMKRKLSVAIAFCGDSKVVFLDEPTSGMDPFSRRFTWNVIRQYRENRCIVLTTHFMDEADLLGDRIAIMAAGRLRCAGSPLFLKKYYGVGYQLTVIKKSNGKMVDNAAAGSDNNGPSETQIIVENIVKGAVPSAKVLSDVGTEISFQLPVGESAAFVSMFEKLDDQISVGTVETYGVSITTLDEVFLMVARGEEGLHGPINSISVEAPNRKDKSVQDFSTTYKAENNLRDKAFQRHVRALFAKRAKNFKRDKKAWFCSTILPTVISLIGFIIVKFAVGQTRNYPSLTLSLEQNNPDIIVDQNPIPFNDPNSNYNCQPGKCISPTDTINISATDEVYFFCGSNMKVDSPVNGTAHCTISESSAVINQITEHGAFGAEQSVGNILESSQSVLDSSHDFASSQYGAIFFTHDTMSQIAPNGSSFDTAVVEMCQQNIGNYTLTEQCDGHRGFGYIINYNYTSLHSSLLYQSVADEAILRMITSDPDYKISASIWPLPITKVEQRYSLAQDSFAAWFLLVLSFPFIAGAFATFVVAERESKAKHLQTVAGVKPSAYWLSTYFWDVMNYQIPLWTVIILMYLLSVDAFTTNTRNVVSGTFSLLILFGPAAAGFTYILSFFFKSPSMCNLFTVCFNFFISMAGAIVVLILRLLAADPTLDKSNLKTAAIVLEWILRFVPSFCLGRGLLFSINIEFFEFVEGIPLTVWSPTIALYDVIFLGMGAVVYIIATVQIDILSTKPKVVNNFHDFFSCKFLLGKGRRAGEHVPIADIDDEDVIAEYARVRGGDADGDLIVLKDLTKRYPNGKLAVNNMSLGIPPGECFGLLGINGAGKTTTMSMLTAEFPPSSGDAILAGFSVSNEPEQTRRTIGYCPQFDAHFMNMTGREHVELYAVIKGVPKEGIKEAVAAKLAEVGLSEHDSNRLSQEYSGGMKRKLSVACATIGQPQIVFLDEPSTGMDPVARRDLWKVISKMVEGKTEDTREKPSVILTTHSMEECEALCPRIGIMAGGKLRCLGSAQRLKTRFGQGYQIEMKIRHAANGDGDVNSTSLQILNKLGLIGDCEDMESVDIDGLTSETFLHLDQVKSVCKHLTNDEYLANMVDVDNPNGYHIHKCAESPIGVSVSELVGFCVEEMRLKSLLDFILNRYSSATLRERQDVKVRFEISSEGVTISSVFANIEGHKDELMIDDYGVSQTSLEQVFNMHAAEAEKAKHNTIDGVQARE
mmetsp:Transcript_28196/g.58760  ORF Transcript_28196/g.58760 Transcript_28196/m.58760 type:complete len:1961 (+) Transcript_28196:86-5968(+)